MTTPGSGPTLVFRSSGGERAFMGGSLLVVGVLLGYVGLTDEPWCLVICLVAVVGIIEQVRARIVIDRVRGEIRSTRVLRTTVVRSADVADVLVGPKRNVFLRLHPSGPTGSARVVTTSLRSTVTSGPGPALATALDVPVVTRWTAAPVPPHPG